MSTNDKTTVASGTAVDEQLRTSSIMQTAQNMPEISQFVAAIREAGLAGDLGTPDFKTLFAPSNEALNGISAEDLREAAARHIVIGRQTEADLRTTRQVRTLAGPVPVQYENGGARFGGARIVRRDIPCVNGQIHVLDGLAQA
jgi:uncharacterized surface protein with fasciclin (FAS1) repeats